MFPSQAKKFDVIILEAFYPDYCPHGIITAPESLSNLRTASCPCMDMRRLNVHQAAYESGRMQWFGGKGNAPHTQQWIIRFSPRYIEQLGKCAYWELSKIAEYSAAFFADDYQLFYSICFASNSAFISFVMNTIGLKTGKAYTESMAGHFQEYFNYLSEFAQREYGLSIEICED